MPNTRIVSSATGSSNQIWQKLDRAVYALGGSTSDLRRATADSVLQRTIAALIMRGKQPTGYMVHVDSGAGLKGLIEAVNPVCSNEYITDPRWNPRELPVRPPYSSEVIPLPVGEMAGPELDAFRAGEGLRFALPEEMLALGAQYRQILRLNPIACRGDFWHDPGDPDMRNRVLVLDDNAGRLNIGLYLDAPVSRWFPHCLVAFVRA